jgi:hypothetical protein
MELTPNYIRENLSEIGEKQALNLLKELINSSNDSDIRRSALETFGSIDDGGNFSFIEQLFLSDESLEMRMYAGKILKESYVNHKKLVRLLDYTLKKVENVEQKIYSVNVLNSIESSKAYKTLIEYLREFFKTKAKEKIPYQQMKDDLAQSVPETVIRKWTNLILTDYYENECGYLITLKKGKIIALNCEGSNLKDVSDIYGFKLLTDLEYLSIQRNFLQKITNLQHLTHLKSLNFSHNKLEKIENLENLHNLEELNLSNNNIGKMENLESLVNLKRLTLSNNVIQSIQNLSSLIYLEALDLSHNEIIDIKNLDNLENLNRLNLSSNKIERMAGFTHLLDLMWLYLNDNNIVQIEGLLTLHKLKGLYLSNNQITTISSLENLSGLKKLELSNNKISNLSGLDKLGELQELYLDNNFIKKFEGLEGLTSLIILHIGRNRIEEFRREFISPLKNLNFIFLNENPLNQKSSLEYQKRIKFP